VGADTGPSPLHREGKRRDEELAVTVRLDATPSPRRPVDISQGGIPISVHAAAQVHQPGSTIDPGRQQIGRQDVHRKRASVPFRGCDPLRIDVDGRVVDQGVDSADGVCLIRHAAGSSALARSPITTPAARRARSSTLLARAEFRACSTTSCPSSRRFRAAARPSPAVDPVINTRAIRRSSQGHSSALIARRSSIARKPSATSSSGNVRSKTLPGSIWRSQMRSTS
jgi:hypothetical protein